MDMIGIVGIAVVTAIASLIVKSLKPELAFAVVIAGSVLLASFAVEWLADTFTFFQSLSKMTGIDENMVKILLKIIGVGYLTEFSVELIQDLGSQSLANKVELCGKIAIFTLSLPILYSLLAILAEILDLL